MSEGPLRRCTWPSCRNLVRDGSRCPLHAKQQQRQIDANRPNAHQRGYNHRWRKASAAYMQDHPLCEECERKGRVTAAQCVDHKIPHRGDEQLFWDSGNWQSLCQRCHARKTARGE